MLLVVLTGCGLFGNKDEVAESPFLLGDMDNHYWVTDPDNDEEDGEGILILSSATIGCAKLTDSNLGWLDELVLEGSGMLFLLEYDSWGDDAHGEDWEGLWVTGYAYSGTRGERLMRDFVFQDGFLYMGAYYGMFNDSWLQVDSDQGGLTGSYSAEHASGSFEAQNCGDWTEPVDTDWGGTGWDTH